MKIQPIVEGHGEVSAVPVLLRRLIAESQVWAVDIGRPIRRHRNNLVREAELEKTVELARRQLDCAAILILFDSDDDCPAELGPTLQECASRAGRDIPCQVLLAHREYEAWFLAAIESLQGQRGVREDAVFPQHPERPRGAKGQLRARMHQGRGYTETADQPAFSDLISLDAAYQRSRSFRKLVASFGTLLRELGEGSEVWPPSSWVLPQAVDSAETIQ